MKHKKEKKIKNLIMSVKLFFIRNHTHKIDFILTTQFKPYIINKMPFADKDKQKEYQRQWEIDNKEKRKQQNKIWREENEEHIKKYNVVNRDKRKEYFKVKITCNCGSVFRRDSKGNHMKSKKRKQYLIANIPLSFEEYDAISRAKYVALSRASDLSNIQIA